ncbi:MAG: hypothetical protein K8F91_18665 [Candidatus Obscuribacterales bacterium]|nr:hypothetical protein [Candidatus Obscuribacterales bacterium]
MNTDSSTTTQAISDQDLTGTGWTAADAIAQAAAARLDTIRFLDQDGCPDLIAQTLDRLGEADIAPRFPDPERLQEAGCDLKALADAADAGLDMDIFAEACRRGLPVAEFVTSISSGRDSMDHINGMLGLFIESVDESTLKPCPVERALARIED